MAAERTTEELVSSADRSEGEQWTTVIHPRTERFDLNLRELWRYRDLIMLIVRRDFIAIYKQTILGPTWFLLQPLFSTVVFTIVFGNIARLSTDGLPQILFYMSGIITWTYFSSCLVKTSDTFVINAPIFGKVYFPRLTVPIATVIINLITFAIQFSLFMIFFGFFIIRGANLHPNLWILFTPFLLLQMAALGLGLGILISSLTTKYRDLANLVAFGVQLWMYATPIVYPISQIPLKWQWLYAFNPMAIVIETFRYAFLGAGVVSFKRLVISIIITVFTLMLGILSFTRVEKTFMDTV